MASSNINVSPVISPDILKNISTSTAIKSFGTQLKDKAKEKVIVGTQTVVSNLVAQKDVLTNRIKALAEKQTKDLEKAKKDYETNQLTKEEYDKSIENITAAITAEKFALEIQIQKIGEDIRNVINSPYDKLKKDRNKFESEIKNLKKRIQDNKNRSKKDLAKQIISNTAKTLVPIITLQLTNSFNSVISQRKKLEILVDQVNEYIDTKVKDEQTVIIATNLRNNAIRLIDSNIKKLQTLQKTLKTITTIITIFSLVLRILSFIPTPVPPKVIITLEKANKLVSGLSVILAVVTLLLANEVIKLNELKERLKEISLKLDGKTLTNLNDDEFKQLTDLFAPVGVNEFSPYKGFTFKIKEEQNPQFVVKGNKRRYAVAIDRYGVETIKSDYSFTLDPNDLVEQLKLVIDQQDLQG